MKIIKTVWTTLKTIFRLKDQPLWLRRIFQLYIFVALLAPIIANNEPLFMMQDGTWSFPAFQKSAYVIIKDNAGEISVLRTAVNWQAVKCEMQVFAPIPYDASSSDLLNYNYASPFGKQWENANISTSEIKPISWRYRHWLGTTKTGADVLAGLIYSTRLSLFIGFFTILIASIIGICIGSLAGFFGDNVIRVSRTSVFISLLLVVPAGFYIFIFPEKIIDSTDKEIILPYFAFLKIILFAFILSLPFTLRLKKISKESKQKSWYIPVDTLLSRFMELFLSVPRLILIITLAAISRPSVISLIIILGCTSWTGIARMIRAEFIRLKAGGFIEAATSLGLSNSRKIFNHLLPNAFAPVRVGIIFGIAGAILAEAGLSFLGIGLSPDTVSWGSMMAAGREQFSAWWLVVFPGLAISVLLIILNRIADQKNQIPQEKLL